MKRTILLVLIMLYGSILACTSTGGHNFHCPPLADLDDEDKLRLINYIPLGITYAELKTCSLELSKTEISEADNGLPTAPFPFAGRLWELRFYFTQGILQSYTAHLDGLDHRTADSLYAEIRDYYAEQFGNKPEQSKIEKAYQNRHVVWRFPTYGVLLSTGRYSDWSFVRWGFYRHLN